MGLSPQLEAVLMSSMPAIEKTAMRAHVQNINPSDGH